MTKDLVINIKNETSNKKQDVELLHGIVNSHKSDNGLPKGVSVSVSLLDKEIKLSDIQYSDFLLRTLHAPVYTQIKNTTDNRRLRFYRHEIPHHIINPITPQLTPDGTPWIFNPSYKWDESKHNIADNNEEITLYGTEIIYLDLEPDELFKIHLKIIAVKTELKNLNKGIDVWS